MKYIVEITETLQKQITVNADTPEKAEEMAQDVYYSGDEVLTAEDLKETTFTALTDGVKKLREFMTELFNTNKKGE